MSTLRFVSAVIAVLLAACGGSPKANAPGSAQNTLPPDHGHGHHGSAPTSPSQDHAHGRHGNGMPHRFENADQWAKVFDDPERDAWQKPADVVTAMRIDPGSTVADIGAGTGYFLPYLSKAVGPAGTVLGLDVEPDMVRHMRERAARDGLANVRAEVAAADDPRLSPGSVSRILIVDTWHHISSREAYAAKLRLALAPGGKVFVVDFTEQSGHGPPKQHRLPPSKVIAELSAGGLAAELLPSALPDQYIVVGQAPR